MDMLASLAGLMETQTLAQHTGTYLDLDLDLELAGLMETQTLAQHTGIEPARSSAYMHLDLDLDLDLEPARSSAYMHPIEDANPMF